ncbi:hypothetical protein HMN09_00071700 [Mycena chlorophos]|uniref:Translocation protein n=1 Tax=Mycena chlorophos TaxID=658473 RepID=A0A8H6WMK9_MYCCL|nr:hypothetical protein HMN09_00071700 [Mycena chlorophos]
MGSTSVLVPVIYLLAVVGGLATFSFIYRRKTAAKTLPPYFPTHAERNIYVTLLQKTDPPASDALLKSALVRRAMTDVQRVLRIREDKPALQNLLQRGSIGEDLWNSLLAAEKELEAEILEVVGEANSFVEGWGQLIFPTANEMIANEKMRSLFEQNETLKQSLQLKYNVPNPTLPALVPPTPNGAEESDVESPRSPSGGKKTAAKKRK